MVPCSHPSQQDVQTLHMPREVFHCPSQQGCTKFVLSLVLRLLGEFVVSWLVGIFFVDSLLMCNFVVWWLVFDSLC